MSFAQYDPTDMVVSSELVISPIWSGGLVTLTGSNFFTSSIQQNSIGGKSFLNVYQLATNASGSAIQFGLAYGHISGSGSAPYNSLVPQYSPTRDVYGQFRNIIYGDENATFSFGGTAYSSRDIYVINVNRSRYKEGIQPGTFNLTLGTGSTTITLTDNSNSTQTTSFIGSNEYWLIVSGSNGLPYNGTNIQTASGSYGLFFPAIGTIILNPRALGLPIANGGLGLVADELTSTSYTSSFSTNANNIFQVIATGGNFTLQSYETVSAKWFFTRVKNQEFNYTTNPSIIDNNGNILYSTLVNNPQTFPTTVGLYDNNNNLLAVAKLSKPLPKDFVHELNIQIKLSF